MTTLTVPSADAPEQELDLPSSANAEPSQACRQRGSPSPRTEQIAHTLVIALLFAAPALMCVRVAVANDPDIWWHLSTGEWMLSHHAIPRADLFSRSLAGKPWQAYSWLFELIVTKLFLRLGLVGIVTYTSATLLALTVALYHMVRRLQADFSLSVLITLAASYSMGHLYMPRPWMFTIVFFILELDILMQVRRTGRLRELAWLPVIFALWSNIHIQFVDGLVVLGLALVETVASHWGLGARTRLRSPWLLAAFAGSIFATMANPFGWHIYRVAYDLAAQSGVLNKISELQSIRFRDSVDFCLLFLALAATAALAWGRRLRVFEVGLLAFAAIVSFRSQRDVWVMATVAAAILASTMTGRNRAVLRLPRMVIPLAAIAAALIVGVGFRLLPVNSAMLKTRVAETLPVHAVEAIQAKGYRGPLYNDFNWGGYLVWALRMPVSMDGRAAFYGDEKINRSLATWSAEPDWASDTDLMSSGLVIGPVKAPLTQILRTDTRFQLVYEDKIAAVFVAHK